MSLQRKKLEFELHKIIGVVMETEIRLEEREAETLKIKEVLAIQSQRKEELSKQLAELTEKEGSK